MPRPIFTLLAELQSTIAELVEALNPLQKLVGTFTPKAGDEPFPMKSPVRRRGPGKKKATSRKSAPASAPPETPAPTAESTAAKKSGRKKRAKGTKPNPKLALQGKYMSAIRGLSKADKAEVKKVRAEQGVEEGVPSAAMRRRRKVLAGDRWGRPPAWPGDPKEAGGRAVARPRWGGRLHLEGKFLGGRGRRGIRPRHSGGAGSPAGRASVSL